MLAFTTVLTVTAQTTIATAQSIFDAITLNDVHFARALIDNGIDVNEASESTGVRSLHYAAYRGNAEIVDMLLSAGADPTARTDSGCGQIRIDSPCFDKHGNRLVERTAAGSALHYAADGGHAEI